MQHVANSSFTFILDLPGFFFFFFGIFRPWLAESTDAKLAAMGGGLDFVCFLSVLGSKAIYQK